MEMIFMNGTTVRWAMVFILTAVLAVFADSRTAYALSADNSALGSDIFVQIAKKKTSAIVNVSYRAKRKGQGFRTPENMPDSFKDYFERFFGERGGEGQAPKRGTGSGFIIDEEGHTLTNFHVVEEADAILVTLEENGEEKEYEADLIGTDPKTDIALVKIKQKKGEGKKFHFLTLGDSDKLEVGEWVVAIGNPFGLSHTVTVGVVSAKGRSIGSGPYDEFIQTDASINPGNSGGPLLNIKGDVIGINTAIIAGNSGGNVGIGFAIPVNMAKNILASLKEKGTVTRGWLGVVVQRVNPEMAKSFGLKDSRGALVGDIIPEGPAQKAGIKRGDVIVKFNGLDVETNEAMPKMVAAVTPGATVDLEIVRDGKKKNIPVSIGVLEDESKKKAESGAGQGWLGLVIQDLTAEQAAALGLAGPEGAQVIDVAPNGPAQSAGIQPGDVIVKFNGQAVKTRDDLTQKVSQSAPGTVAEVEVVRNQKHLTLKTTVGQPSATAEDEKKGPRGWLGLAFNRVPTEAAKANNLKTGEGVQVVDVIPNGPAEKAGLKRGDIIVKFDNKDLKTDDAFPKSVSGAVPGAHVDLEILREGKHKTVKVTVGDFQKAEAPPLGPEDMLGIQVQEITPEIANSLRLKSSEGVLISEILPGEAGGESGLRRGDVVKEINRKPIKDLKEYKEFVAKVKKGDTILFLVNRGGTTIYIAVKLK
jgi:serine protease Do